MEKLKRSLSFRKKKEHVPECSKPHQWQEDERKVREGTCSFQVRYLGCIEVFESRGMQVCEEAVKALKSRNSRSVWKRMSMRRKNRNKDKKDKQCKGKYQRAILYVSGDALRVVDEISKGLIVDQTIEKVSFCAPDRNHEKGFAYICRDGTTRRWMCHGFLALKESPRMGERLSHAVGCAFAICLEKKQKREKDTVTVQYNDKGTCFTRTGSFRQASLTERLADPQSTILAEPIPTREAANPYAVQRPRASQDMLVRQGSFRGFEKLSESSPFKRQLSLRLNELPSTLERRQHNGVHHNGPSESPIPEASPSKENAEDSIAEMCQQLTQGLSALGSDEPFASAPAVTNNAAPNSSTPPHAGVVHSSPQHGGIAAQQPLATGYTTTVQGRTIGLPDPIRQNNPWGGIIGPAQTASAQAPPPQAAVHRKPSDAEMWLHSTASVVASPPMQPQDPFSGVPSMTNGSSYASPYAMPPGSMAGPQRAPPMSQLRSHSIDTADMWSGQRGPSLRQLSQRPEVTQFQSQQGTTHWSSPAAPQPAPQPAFHTGPDPFDAAWAAKSSSNNNPFQSKDSVTKTFEVKL